MKNVELNMVVNGKEVTEIFQVADNYTEQYISDMLKDWIFNHFEVNWKKVSTNG